MERFSGLQQNRVSGKLQESIEESLEQSYPGYGYPQKNCELMKSIAQLRSWIQTEYQNLHITDEFLTMANERYNPRVPQLNDLLKLPAKSLGFLLSKELLQSGGLLLNGPKRMAENNTEYWKQRLEKSLPVYMKILMSNNVKQPDLVLSVMIASTLNINWQSYLRGRRFTKKDFEAVACAVELMNQCPDFLTIKWEEKLNLHILSL